MESTANATAPNAANLAAGLLESTIPGFSIITRVLSEYLHIDVSQYVGHLVVVIGIWTASSYIYDRAFALFSEWFMSTAQIRYSDEIYNYMMFWVAQHKVSRDATKFIASMRTGHDWSSESDDEEVTDDEDEGELTDEKLTSMRISRRARPLKYTPMRGSTHYFWFRGSLIRFERVQEAGQQGGWGWGNSTREEIFLSCFGRDTKALKALLVEAQRMYLERDGTRTVIYRGGKYPGGGDEIEWRRSMARPPRPMSTVVLDEEQKRLIVADMKEYLHPRTKRWYSDRGIPYRRGYLLHGPPGTGKSSLCFALAGVLQLPIYVTNLNSKSMTEDVLQNLFRDLPERSIVLLEDIDAAGLAVEKRGDRDAAGLVPGAGTQTIRIDDDDDENNTTGIKPLSRSQTNLTVNIPGVSGPAAPSDVTNRGISFSGFLNIIDGVASAEGRILIMTTNHIEKLDPALVRPGRIDLIVHFTNATREMIEGLFLAIYSEKDKASAEKDRKKKQDAAAPTEADKQQPQSPTVGTPGLLKKLRHGKTEDEITLLAKQFAQRLPSDDISPAEIQGYLLKHKMDPAAAVEQTDDWLAERALKSTMR